MYSSTYQWSATGGDFDTKVCPVVSWTATDGAIGGVGNRVTRQAPGKEGTFYVMVTVNDGRGGTATQQVLLTVGAAQRAVVVNLTVGDSGTVWNDGYVESRLVYTDGNLQIGQIVVFLRKPLDFGGVAQTPPCFKDTVTFWSVGVENERDL